MNLRAASIALVTVALALPVSSGCGGPKDARAPVAAAPAPGYAKVLRPKIEALLKETLAPGAGVFVRSAEGDWSETFGARTRGGSDKPGRGDHVRIGSNTKTMIGTVVLQLVEEGRLRLDAPVSNYKLGVPDGDTIPIELLLDMRSGLFNYSELPALNEALDKTPARVWKPEELVELAVAQRPYFAPGREFHYSNTNTVLLGLIVEQVTKNSIEKELKHRIFDKLGMRDTSMPRLSSGALPQPYPRGYRYGTNLDTLSSEVLPPERQSAAKNGTWAPLDATDGNPSWAWTAGAVISNGPDLVRYAKALVEGELLGADMQKRRLESVISTNPKDPKAPAYGWALAKLGPMYGHTGELPGYNTFVGYDPEKKLTVVTWTSLSAAPDGRAPAVEIARTIVGHFHPSATDH
jgi:D-alanyl-D-alanine carboxypeptidase